MLSSRIEGTETTLGQLLAAEAGVPGDRDPSDLREVANYVSALEYGVRRLKTLPLSLRLVRELHSKLMQGVRGGRAAAGNFRRSQNWIGPPQATIESALYIPPPPQEMTRCLDAWESFLHDRSLPPLVQIALAHYQFEAIHPFLDGNGRVGRLLITLFLVERDILPTPLLYLSAYFEATRPQYYERLRAISERGEWEEWFHYFLHGVGWQAEDAVRRAERMNRRLETWRRAVAGDSSRVPAAVIDRLAANPFLTVSRTAERLNIAFTTAQRAIGKLEKLSILHQVGGAKRNRVYCAKGLFSILEAPAGRPPAR